MSRTASIIISVLLLVFAVLLFTVWRPLLDEHGAYIAIGIALLAVFLSLVPSRVPGDASPRERAGGGSPREG